MLRASEGNEPSSKEVQAADQPQPVKTDTGAVPSGSVYNDDLPRVERAELSSSMKDKMRKEYLGLGGSENTAMGANYYLWIIVGISTLAIASWLSGAI